MKKHSEKAYNMLRIFLDVVRVNPTRFVLQYAISIASFVFLGLFIPQLQNVFNNVAALIGTPSADNLRTLLVSLLILFLYKCGSECLEIFNGYLGQASYHSCSAHFIDLYNHKLSKVSALAFENEQNLDLYSKALEGATTVRQTLHTLMDVFTVYIPYFVTVSIYLTKQDPSLLVILALLAIPVLVTNQIKKRINTKLHNNAVVSQRKKEEYAKYLSDSAYFKEVRVNRLFPHFYHKYQEARAEYNRFFVQANRKKLTVDLVTKMITLLGFLAIVGLLMQRMVTGVISIGAFGAIFYSLEEMYGLMDEVLVSRMAEYHSYLPSLKSLINMLNDKTIETQPSNAPKDFTNLSLENVSFTYPNAQHAALKNISITIRKNDRIAVVGHNGSGKSTLAKILTGLYQPTNGSIVMDGKPVNRMNTGNVSVMFQNFNRYKETVLNNIRISELELDTDLQQERNRAGEMLEKVSLEFAQQDDVASGLDMLCAREFGGTDLSGGQWQKLAAARMLYRDRDFVVLDEPTAAIDPVSEYQLFDLFEKETKDKTAVIITHRMASIRFCNKIIVLQDGEIESVGDHETLMKNSPLYYQLYHAVEECYE